MESDDQSNPPAEPETGPGAINPSRKGTDSSAAALFSIGAPRTAGGRAPWEPPTPEELQPDFPQYEISAVLGHGGMGAVYKRWQKSLDRFVAIKILPPDPDSGMAGFTRRFKREAKAMAPASSPCMTRGRPPAGCSTPSWNASRGRTCSALSVSVAVSIPVRRFASLPPCATRSLTRMPTGSGRFRVSSLRFQVRFWKPETWNLKLETFPTFCAHI